MIKKMKTFTKKCIVGWFVLELSHFKGDSHLKVNGKNNK